MAFVKERAGSSVTPVLRYRDAGRRAVDWLADSFGFEKRLVVPGEGNTIRHSQLVFGSGTIMVGSERDGASFIDGLGNHVINYLKQLDGIFTGRFTAKSAILVL